MSAILLAPFLLTACASSPTDRPVQDTQENIPNSSATDAGPVDANSILENIGAIDQQSLPAGHCGLFLWRKSAERKLIFFSDMGDKTALMSLAGKRTLFTRTAAASEAAPGLYRVQHFKGAHYNMEIRVIYEARDGLTDGALIPTGSLKLEDSKGWQTIFPVAGLVGCQSTRS